MEEEILALEALVRQLETSVRKEDPKHVKMLERSKRYASSHKQSRHKHSSEWDKANPEKRRQRWRRWKAKQRILNQKEK